MADRHEAAARSEELLAQTDWLGRLASRLVTDADREDLIQDVLLRAIRSRERPTHLRGWLATVARNLAASRRDREARRRSRERIVARPEDAMPSAAETVEAFATHRAVVNAVMELDEPYRSAVLLRFWEDLPPREIARRTGEPVETVRTRIKRGVDRLRAKLDREAGSRRAWLLPLTQVGAVRTALESGAPAAPAAVPVLAGVLSMKTATFVAVTAALVCGLIVTFAWLPRTSDAADPDVVADETGIERVVDDPGHADPVASAVSRVEVPEEQASGALLVRVRYADDTAAGDVGVYVRLLGSDESGVERTTNGDGLATFEKLRSGVHRVVLDRGIESRAMVRPGVESGCEIRIERGILVHGRVVTLDRQPVTGARVFALDGDHHDGMRLLTTTDAAGEFELRDAAPGLELHARADGWQPSRLRGAERVTGIPGERVDVEIVLGARGHSLSGEVAGDDGRSVPHAWVGIGVDEDSRREVEGLEAIRTDADGMLDRESFFVRADAEGRFRTTEVPWGDVAVFARGVGASAHLVGSARVRVERDAENRVVVRLTPGGTLVGTVRDETGALYAGVRLRAGFRGSPEIGELARGFGPELADRSCESASDGTYRLDGLFAGEHRLGRVVGERDPRIERVEVEAGEVRRLDLTLPRTWQMRVVVRSVSGVPLEGWAVMLSERGTIAYHSADSSLTDVQGVHVASGLRADRYVLSVHAPDPEGDRPFRRIPSFMTNVERGAAEVTVAVAPPEASIVGRVVDATGSPVGRGRIECSVRGFAELVRADIGPDGGFRFARLPGGDYLLAIHGRDQPFASRVVNVAPGSVCDVGDVVLPERALLEVEVLAEDGGEIERPELWLSRRTSDAAAGSGEWERVAGLRRVEREGVWRSDAVASGDYVLHVTGRDVAPVLREVRLVAGAPRRLRVSCVRGIEQELSVELSEGGSGRSRPLRGSIEIRDLLGRRLLGRGFEGVVQPPERLVERLRVRLQPGRYVVVAGTVGSGDPAESTIVVDGSPVRVVVE